MLKGILLTVLLLAFVAFTLYKAIYDILILSKRDLIQKLKDSGYSNIEISKPEYEDKENSFTDTPLSLLNIGKVPISYVHFFEVKCKDDSGNVCRIVARVTSLYFMKARIIIKRIN